MLLGCKGICAPRPDLDIVLPEDEPQKKNPKAGLPGAGMLQQKDQGACSGNKATQKEIDIEIDAALALRLQKTEIQEWRQAQEGLEQQPKKTIFTGKDAQQSLQSRKTVANGQPDCDACCDNFCGLICFCIECFCCPYGDTNESGYV